MRRRLYNNLLNALIPLSVLRQSQAFGWDAEWLADVEKDHDSWAPDELWAAQQRHPASAAYPPKAAGGKHRADDSPHLSLVPAADDASRAANVSVVGGPLKSDEQIIEELVADYRKFLRDCFARRFPPHNR